jgi:hypothetical protein
MTRLRYPPITRGALYSVVFLFVLAVGFGVGNLLWTAHLVGQADTRWCALLRDYPAPRLPPHATTLEVRRQADYLALRRSLGCGPVPARSRARGR